MRLALALLVAIGLVVAGQQLSDASTRRLVAAMVQLGPASGWRCAHGGAYVYDPRRERADSVLVADAPEQLAPQGVRVVRVEVDLRGGETTLWALGPETNPEAKPNRVLVVRPAVLRAISIDGMTLCQAGLRGWFSVGDHALE